MRAIHHLLAYLLSLIGGLIVMTLSSPSVVAWGLRPSLFPPTDLLRALPFAIAASIVPYVGAIIVLRKLGLRGQGAHMLAGCAVAFVSHMLLWLVLGGGLAPQILFGERAILGTLLAGAVAGYVHYGLLAPKTGAAGKGAAS